MPKFCAAIGCVNGSNKSDCRQKNISFHKFPTKDSIRLTQWLIALKRENFQPTEHSVLCSEHFCEEDFEKITPINKRRILKPDTVPRKFSYTKRASKRKRMSNKFEQSSSSPVSADPRSSPSPTPVADSEFVTEKECQTKDQIISILLSVNQRLREENAYLREKLHYHSVDVRTLTDSDLKALTGFNEIQMNAIFKYVNCPNQNLNNQENDVENA